MTKLYDLVSAEDLWGAMGAGLIAERFAEDGQRILNYTDAAMYTPGAWNNPAVRICRGLIVSPLDYVVARPWAKFFNHNQAEAGELDFDAPVEVTDKLDGSLGIIHVAQDGSTRVATRGSFESEQAQHATRWLSERPGWVLDDSYGWTPLVEIIYPGNRIVCDYGDRDELVLLGAVHIESGDYVGPEAAARVTGWPYKLADTFEYMTLREALEAPPRPGAEGLCVRYPDNRIVKIKQEDYVRLHRIVTGLSERSIWGAVTLGQSLEDVLAELPDELHEWTRMTWRNLEVNVGLDLVGTDLAHRDILAAVSDSDGRFERREYAELAKDSRFRPYLFMVLDGKNPQPAILKSYKPKGDTRAKVFSQAVA
jgi:RNA ligase